MVAVLSLLHKGVRALTGDITDDEARQAVEAVLRGGAVGPRSRQRALLRHIVAEKLAGRADRLKAYAIGCDVFGRPATFDPATDSVVRVEMARLRQSLAHHYRTAGVDDPVVISVPAGGYAPVLTRRHDQATPIKDETPQTGRPPRASRLFALVAVALLAAVSLATWLTQESSRPDRVRIAIVAEADGPSLRTMASSALSLAAEFNHLAVVDTPPSSPTPEDYTLRLSQTPEGVSAVVVHARSGVVVAAETLPQSDAEPLAALLQTWGPVLADYARRGDFTPVTECLQRERQYFARQTDARHAAAQACAEALIAQGVRDPLIFQALARMHREEYSDGRNRRPGDPLARALDAALAAEALAPNDAGLQDTLLGIVQYMGLENETQRIAARILTLSPDDPNRLADVASRLAYAGVYEQALDLIARSVALAPASDGGRDLVRVLALLGLGRIDEAAAAAEALVGSTNPLRLSVAAAAAALAGDDARAAELAVAMRAADPNFAADPRAQYERRRFEEAQVDRLMKGLKAAVALSPASRPRSP